MLFLAVGSSRFSSSVLRQFSNRPSSCWSICWRTATPLAPRFSSWGRKLQWGQMGEAFRSSLTSVKHGLELCQPGLKLSQSRMRQQRYAGQLLQAFQPGVLEQFLLFAVLVDSQPSLLVQVEVGRPVVVLYLLRAPD